MKKSYVVFVLAPLLYQSTSYAETSTGFYIAGKLGISQQRLQNRSLSVTEYMLSNGASAADSAQFGNSKKNAFHSGIGVGYNFVPAFNLPVRLEIEYINRLSATQSSYHAGMDYELLFPNYRDNELMPKATIRSQTVMLNGYWDMMDLDTFHPYLFAGIGLAANKVSYQTDYRNRSSRGSMQIGERNINRLAWNVGLGVGKEINEHWLVDLGYRFMSVGNLSSDAAWRSSYGPLGRVFDITANSKGKLQYQDVQISIRYAF